ncbi:MAG: uracil-DNA glycosylase [Clostridiales Family XIII bacterium]|jgi:uracil-DNA glycosylase|nr:uracil-DNA glycosylase [Clostridiales Family XIII bacterium]
MVNIGNDWDELLKGEFEKEYYLNLREFLKKEYSAQVAMPSMHDIFNALKYTPYREVKAVILGQDPYHGPGQAHGLCFSVPKGVAPPPSLVNIFKEMEADLGIPFPGHGCLEGWARQGVLLLNTVLTVRAGVANSHKDKGWEIFTDRVIWLLAQRDDPMVFLLWGANAKAKAALIGNRRHLTLTAAHPSPLSAHNGFFGCGHFRKTNEFLAQFGKSVDWRLKPPE